MLVCATAMFFCSCGVFIAGYYDAIRDANEAAALTTVKSIAEQQTLYFNAHERKTFGTFDEMLKANLLDSRFAGDAPVLAGYIFTMSIVPKSRVQPSSYTINADPQQAEGVGATGGKHYFFDSKTNTTHARRSQSATIDDPLIQE